jgi:hypothetical protein
METLKPPKKKTATQLLKEYMLTVEEAEEILLSAFNLFTQEEKEQDEQNANEMEELDITE